jgi:NADPH-dependent curcumin reductase CurA
MKEIILNSRPDGIPNANSFKLVDWTPKKLSSGEVLVEVQSFSLDPYMRGRMDDAKSYSAPVELGARMEAGGVGRIIESKSASFTEGDYIFGMTGWASHAILNEKAVRKLALKQQHLTRALGVLGMPGFTGWFGLNQFGRPKSGETLVVAAATGPVGSIVGQLAKHAGLNVVGLAGTDEKCRIAIEDFDFDQCLNHRAYHSSKELRNALANFCPNGIDIYFENVAGPILEAILPMMNVHGRIPLCGMISWYNAGRLGADALFDTLSVPKMWRTILVKRLSINGFIISDHWKQFPNFLNEVEPFVNEGLIKYIEDITQGLENAPQKFIGMLDGKNHGKTIIQLF